MTALTRRLGALLTATCLALAMLSGCSAPSDYTSRFIRYDTLQDGTRVAVVTPEGIGGPAEVQASTNLADLKPGDPVLVKEVGKDWDQPQWMPTAVVVGRVGD